MRHVENDMIFVVVVGFFAIVVGEKFANYWISAFIIGTMVATAIFMDLQEKYKAEDLSKRYIKKIAGFVQKVIYIPSLGVTYIELTNLEEIKTAFVKGDFSNLTNQYILLGYDCSNCELEHCIVL